MDSPAQYHLYFASWMDGLAERSGPLDLPVRECAVRNYPWRVSGVVAVPVGVPVVNKSNLGILISLVRLEQCGNTYVPTSVFFPSLHRFIH